MCPLPLQNIIMNGCEIVKVRVGRMKLLILLLFQIFVELDKAVKAWSFESLCLGNAFH